VNASPFYKKVVTLDYNILAKKLQYFSTIMQVRRAKKMFSKGGSSENCF